MSAGELTAGNGESVKVYKRQEVIEHLKMIQAVIDRMGRNSFQLKGWSAALATGWLVFVARSSDVSVDPWWLAIIPFALLFALDGYFLWQERLFRGLYDEVRIKDETDFSMRTQAMGFWQRSFGWIGGCLPSQSRPFPTIFIFHCGIIVLLIIVEISNVNRAQGLL